MILATLRARLWVAHKSLPKKRTLPSIVRSRTIWPSRVSSWLSTVNFVAPLTLALLRCRSICNRLTANDWHLERSAQYIVVRNCCSSD